MAEEKEPKKPLDPVDWCKKYFKHNPYDSTICVPNGIKKKEKYCCICNCRIYSGFFMDDGNWYCDKHKQVYYLTNDEKIEIKGRYENKNK